MQVTCRATGLSGCASARVRALDVARGAYRIVRPIAYKDFTLPDATRQGLGLGCVALSENCLRLYCVRKFTCLPTCMLKPAQLPAFPRASRGRTQQSRKQRWHGPDRREAVGDRVGHDGGGGGRADVAQRARARAAPGRRGAHHRGHLPRHPRGGRPGCRRHRGHEVRSCLLREHRAASNVCAPNIKGGCRASNGAAEPVAVVTEVMRCAARNTK